MRTHLLLPLSECLSHTPIMVLLRVASHPHMLSREKKNGEEGQPQGSIISNPTSEVHLTLSYSLSRSAFFLSQSLCLFL